MGTDAGSAIGHREGGSEDDDWIGVAEAAELMETSPELVLHRVRHGHLHLSRREVAALALSEMPKRVALAEFVRLSEEIEGQMDADGPAVDDYDKDTDDER